MAAPGATSVLYAAPYDASGRLIALCERLRGAFVEAGLVVPEDRGLKLHATLVNTVYAGEGGREGWANRARETNGAEELGLQGKGKSLSGVGPDQGETPDEPADGTMPSKRHARGSGTKGKRRLKPLRIDARPLIKRWKDEEWAQVTVEKVVICEMGAKTESDGLIRYREIAGASLL